MLLRICQCTAYLRAARRGGSEEPSLAEIFRLKPAKSRIDWENFSYGCTRRRHSWRAVYRSDGGQGSFRAVVVYGATLSSSNELQRAHKPRPHTGTVQPQHSDPHTHTLRTSAHTSPEPSRHDVRASGATHPHTHTLRTSARTSPEPSRHDVRASGATPSPCPAAEN
jgi:hypothetical protein